ncbi:MAG: biopolymer transporter ExbD [Ignavibacteriales bacterium]|nr:biopolymer transporter ExbD [Ignavibacteriales bacterium]
MKFETKSQPISAFNFSSLTDIVMLLLIFFLLTSQFVIQTGIKVKLPGAQNNEQALPSKMIVTITEQSRVYLGSEEITIDKLAGRLEEIKKSSSENNLIIRADKTVKIDLIIRVIDAAKGIGIDKFTIETEKTSV